MSAQLALNVRLRDACAFENFVPGANAEALEHVHALLERRSTVGVFFLWGERGCGKTHLLQAACRTGDPARAPIYVPLAEAPNLTPAMLEDTERHGVVCLDDLDRIAGDRAWETALFSLYERLRAAGGVLMVTAVANPVHLRLAMPELTTRLNAGLVYRLQSLTDADKIAAIELRGRNRGLDMDHDVARYILARYPRDTHSLFALLDRIDRQSLASQRRVTVPFIRALEAGT